MNTINKSSLYAVLAGLLLSSQAAYGAIAGQAQFVNGNVQVTTLDGISRPLKKGDNINEGDAVSTAFASSAQIKMQDGGFVAIRPDTQMKFDKFVFTGKQDGSERGFFSLVKGGFRAVTGMVGRVNKQNYKITTPAATIGIRGTDHETFVVPVGSALVAAGAYSKVNVGETTLTTNLGTVNVLPNQMGYASGMNDLPKLAPINTNIFTVSATPTKTIKESSEDKKENDKQEQQAAKQQDGKEGKPEKTEQASSGERGGKPADRQEAKQASQQGEKHEGKQGTPGDNGGGAVAGVASAAPVAAGEGMAATAGETVRVMSVVDSPSGKPMANTAPPPAPPQVMAPPPQPAPIVQVAPIKLADTSGNTINASSATLQNKDGVTSNITGTQITLLPLILSAPGIQQRIMFDVPVTGGLHEGWISGFNNFGATVNAAANTLYVLNGNKNLLEILDTPYSTYDQTLSVANIVSADIKFKGGAGADVFVAPDNSIYMGRWAGGSMTVTDKAATAPFTVNAGMSSTHWVVAQMTPEISSGVSIVKNMTGTTNYTMLAATRPTDSFGNVGSVTAATLTANFTAQSVASSATFTFSKTDTANISAKNMVFNISQSAIPLVGAGFSDTWPNVTSTVTCSSTSAVSDCTTGTWSAWLDGSITGTAGATAFVNYYLYNKSAPTPTAGGSYTDMVRSIVAFSAATAPTVPATTTPATVSSAAYVANHVAVQGAGQFVSLGNGSSLAVAADLTYVTGAAGGGSASGALSSATYRNFAGTPFSHTSTISGGTASSTNAPAFASTGIQYGAWTGYTGQQGGYTTQLDGINHGTVKAWMYGPQGYLDTGYLAAGAATGAMATTFIYQMDGATAPYSQTSGLSGTLGSASITANFVSMTVSANLQLAMPGAENWGASFANQMFSAVNGGQFAGAATVTRSVGVGAALTACTTCGGSLSGAFTGQNFAGAILAYNLYDQTASSYKDVGGNVALTRNYTGSTNSAVVNATAVPTGNLLVANGGSVSAYAASSVTKNAGNALTGYSLSSGTASNTYTYSTTVTCATCPATAAGQVASSGIYYGNWNTGSYTTSWGTTSAASIAPTYWITGPEAGPLYLPQALTGTASYALDAGQVSNSAGVAGTFAGTTALTLDFAKQTVGINLDFSIKDTAATPVLHTWSVKTLPGNEAVLKGNQGLGGAVFHASTAAIMSGTVGNNTGNGLLTVAVDGLAGNVTGPSAYVDGQLTGNGLTGAIISFNLNGFLNAGPSTAWAYEYLQGVVAFSGVASNTATSHRYIATSYYDTAAAMPQPALGVYANNATRVTQDAAGNLTQFDNQFVSASGNNGLPQTLASGTSTLADHGTDAVSGISWGRWAGGAINVTNRQTGVAVPTTQAGSLHWIAEPVTTSATTLPVSGTYAYTKAGGTSPTDNLGNVGTLNSATLTADFTAQTVSLGVNATVNGATLNAAAASAPIIQKTAFYASTQDPATGLAVTCTGATCGATSGIVVGKFTGAGATGAAMSYGLQNGSSTVSGVVAFHR